jgi:hypothetical protein
MRDQRRPEGGMSRAALLTREFKALVAGVARRNDMAQKLSGGCACGAIHYECSADPVLMLNCHCRDCQQASGSAYAAIVVLPKSAVQISGEPRYHKVVGQAGKAIERGFCPNCGSQVTVKLERLPNILGLQAGSLVDPSIYRPAMDVFTVSAQPWDHMDPTVQKHTHAPPM